MEFLDSEVIREFEYVFIFLKWAIIFYLGFYTARRIGLTSRKNRFDYFKDLKEEFLNQELLKDRNKVAAFWVKSRILDLRDNQYGTIRCFELGRIKSDNEDAILDLVEEKLGLRVIVNIDADFLEENSDIIEKTENVLNVYEHLGKLVDGGIISKADARLFFYTMMADTFVACLPYILYRRRYKPQYAHKMQLMLKVLPNVSGDLAKV